MDADAAALGADQRLMRPRVLTAFRVLEATPELAAKVDAHNVMGRAPESFEAFFEFEYGAYRHGDGAGLLYDYVNIGIEIEEGNVTTLAELPAARSLPRLCPHLLPLDHCTPPLDGIEIILSLNQPAPPDYGPFQIPVEAMLFYGRLFREIVDAGREIAAFTKPEDDFKALAATDWPLTIAAFVRMVPQEDRIAGTLRMLVGEALRHLARWSGIGTTFHWLGGHAPEQHYIASDPVIGTLAVQAYEYLRHAEMHVCECGRVVDMTGRKRRPQRNRRVWCYKCRAEGRDRLAVEKRRAARKRGKRG